MIELIHTCDTLVFGCGNPLFGDDGFGPAVIDYLDANYTPPQKTAWIDVGTSIRDILFDIILADKKPDTIIIIDAVDVEGKKPGDIFEIDIDEISPEKSSDFSLHQFPTTNMLKEIKEETKITVILIAAQITAIPDTVAPGMSEPLLKAVPEVCSKIAGLIMK
jgi:coenzyme F420 hydrogenase subunit delta